MKNKSKNKNSKTNPQILHGNQAKITGSVESLLGFGAAVSGSVPVESQEEQVRNAKRFVEDNPK